MTYEERRSAFHGGMGKRGGSRFIWDYASVVSIHECGVSGTAKSQKA